MGANAGQYAQTLRWSGYDGRIVSFEPLSAAFSDLEARAAADSRWVAHRLALGDCDGSAEIHIAANSWSSSLLNMTEAHVRGDPRSAYVGSETVPVARLDSVWDKLVGADDRVFLKIDVQGYEMRVLGGAEAHLGKLAGVQVELSLASLYAGGAPWRTVVDHLESRGFTLVGLEPGFEDPSSGYLLQADGIFARR